MNKKYIACLYAGILLAATICVTTAAQFLEKNSINIFSDANQGGPSMTVKGVETDHQTTTNINTFTFTVAQQEIKLWSKNGKYYAFLPSACKEAGLAPEISEEIDPDAIVRMYSEHIPAVFINTQSGTSDLINTNKDAKEA